MSGGGKARRGLILQGCREPVQALILSQSDDAVHLYSAKHSAVAADEIAQWLIARQAQSFDAVFVPAGARVAIHVDRALIIDLDPAGRKLSYATSIENTINHRLD